MSSRDENSIIEIEPSSPAAASIIWLHGLGADGHDFEPIVPELGLPDQLAVRFVFPHAPYRPVTINAGYVMRAWYDIVAFNRDVQEDAAGIRESERILQGLIRREMERGVTTDRIVLAGFSQGGAIALYTGLRFPQRLAGILALSTYLPLAAALEAEVSSANTSVPIFMAHGTDDPIVPFAMAQSSYKRLKGYNANVEFHTYPMQHSVAQEEIRDIGRWLERLLLRVP